MKKKFINTTTFILSIILILSVASCSKEKSENVVSEGSSQKIIITYKNYTQPTCYFMGSDNRQSGDLL